ncbi:hypothetical protein RO3G_10371 [Rhizopus delemar RA 99-880]|uniref:Uncharacterized protein n=1 Tax=Rhizopus delemar (strain RA 99-880 / ATCC MYA-4621 / FGSC 9543 / NRRL 43880) TaxID=246409 RepID=I1CB31_RHIO9|nr:hypothetical protein RO3G_10371 [Rhizopus delemar RA 99-880]|eukprot:EIE85661.1 hypothetical protein RO3G_10371 [Rhizopus delemar RA 99-880]
MDPTCLMEQEFRQLTSVLSRAIIGIRKHKNYYSLLLHILSSVEFSSSLGA